jgi:hypothetical protein
MNMTSRITHLSTLATSLLLGVALALLPMSVHAHGTHEPLHGGIVQMVGDTAVELVANGNDAYVYVVEHDSEFSSNGSTGKLTVLRNGATTTAALTPDGTNRFIARGAGIGSGARVIVALTMAGGGSKLSARFAVP